MFRKIFISVLIVLVAISCSAFLHFSEKEHLRLPEEIVRLKWNRAKPEDSMLQSGDLVFRHSRGVISNMLLEFSRHEKKYSHVGILSMENGKAFVYHAIGGEENRSNKLRKDPLGDFCNPSTVHSFGIYRLDLGSEQLCALDSAVKRQFENGLEFDAKFDLASDDKMYCSEFVYKTVMKVAAQRNYLSLSSVSKINYVACDDLYLNPHSRFLYSYNY